MLMTKWTVGEGGELNSKQAECALELLSEWLNVQAL